MNVSGGMGTSDKSGHVYVNVVVSEESHVALENVDTFMSMRSVVYGKPWSGS